LEFALHWPLRIKSRACDSDGSVFFSSLAPRACSPPVAVAKALPQGNPVSPLKIRRPMPLRRIFCVKPSPFTTQRKRWRWTGSSLQKTTSAGLTMSVRNQPQVIMKNSSARDQNCKIANLSDADPGETAFLELTQPDKTILLVRKDGQWEIFRSEGESTSFAKMPPREPVWLP